MGTKKADQLLGRSKIKENRSGYDEIKKDHILEFEQIGDDYRLRSRSSAKADRELAKIHFHIREGDEDFKLDPVMYYGRKPFEVAVELMTANWVYAFGLGQIEDHLHMVYVFGRPKDVLPGDKKQLVVLFIPLQPFRAQQQNGVAHGEGGDG